MNEEQDEYVADALTLDQIVDSDVADKLAVTNEKTVTPKFSVPCDAAEKSGEKQPPKNRKRFIFGNVENQKQEEASNSKVTEVKEWQEDKENQAEKENLAIVESQ